MELTAGTPGSADRAPARPVGFRPGPRPMTRQSNVRRKRLEIALFSGPALLVYVVFVLLPIGFAVYYSLFKWNGIEPLANFIGLDNYHRAFTDPVFLRAQQHNLFFVIGSIAVQLPIALAIALAAQPAHPRARGLPDPGLHPLCGVRGHHRRALAAHPATGQRHGPAPAVGRPRADGSSCGWPTRTSCCGRCCSSCPGSTSASPSSCSWPGCRTCRTSCTRRPRSTARAGGRPSGASPFRCSAPPSGSGSSCR